MITNPYGARYLYSLNQVLVTANSGGIGSPTTTSVSPTSLPTSASPQLITVYGSNFKPAGDPNASMLIIRDPANNPYVRTPSNVTANSMPYCVNVQSATGTWSVVVTNAGQPASNAQTFTVATPPPNTGSWVVNLAPAAANTAGAQWQVDGGSYHNSGDIAAGLTPVSHPISFKTVSGYTAPANVPANIVAGQQTAINATYAVVVASTYTLTRNYDGVQRSVSASPTASGSIYTAGTAVQLTASANYCYHFVSWSGDATGTANPTTITMDGNKSVTANFAAGDPNLGTVIVRILPQAAAAAGVTWGGRANEFRLSGDSVINYPGTYLLTFHTVDGWLGPASGSIHVVAGQTGNYTATFTADTTPGLWTVTLSPPSAAAAGAWHVNGGAAQASGVTVSMPPGANYSLTFDPVPGWTAPAARTVNLARGQTTFVNASWACFERTDKKVESFV